MINVIFGKRSNLSLCISNNLDNCVLISSSSINEELNQIDFGSYKKVNFIFNQFQPSVLLNNFDSPVDYINRSILNTAIILEYIKKEKINVHKIIYTSSSSVYGDNHLCEEDDLLAPKGMHGCLKLANEKLIKFFCQEMNIDYSIARIFNMYGGNDKFSVVNKIITSLLQNKTFNLINNGNSIRDYIHIDDVVCAYKKLLDSKNMPIINISTGRGVSVSSLFTYLAKQDIKVKHKKIDADEISLSIGDNTQLIKMIGEYNFMKVEDYITLKLNLIQ